MAFFKIWSEMEWNHIPGISTSIMDLGWHPYREEFDALREQILSRVNFQCQGVLLPRITVGQGPIVLSVGAGGGCLDIFFSHLSLLFSFSLSLGDGPI